MDDQVMQRTVRDARIAGRAQRRVRTEPARSDGQASRVTTSLPCAWPTASVARPSAARSSGSTSWSCTSREPPEGARQRTTSVRPQPGDMRAVQMTRFGGPEVLEVLDLPEPEPGPGQKLYDVSIAGVNRHPSLAEHSTE
jgi:hypothetical protein